ncbi:hypothetical protein FHS18_005765 [Paenibacillus phyllosphaerae]|uniref:Copper amine oxidase-like N-terminal domain-containing protein n=1 Tax=Paenibacillus phyllosphaerae TaxID=274593 RepID=A0A7W5FQW2_9BACL|nr:copper amine oxidase N-terminal domain-containing protein [Paenibacillus phyllosphaerae]MBB3113652.1 hypothetical protein [Paenibacillus phyllosphaerae]
MTTNKKKIIASFAVATMLIATAVPTAFAASKAETDFKKAALDIKVLYNARQIASDVPPQNVRGTVFVPFSAVSKALGAQLALSSNGKEITFAKAGKKVKITIGSKTAVANGKNISLNEAPYIKNNRTMVPTRFISEQLGEKVEWDSTVQFVWIGHKDVPQVTEIANAQDVTPYKSYYSGKSGQFILNAGTKNEMKTVRIIKPSDFPFKIEDEIYYRIDKTVNLEGGEALQTIVYDKAEMGRAYYLLQKNSPTRARNDVSYSTFNGKTYHYNLVASSSDQFGTYAENYKNVKLKNIDYIGIYALGSVDSLLLIKNEL